MSTVWSFNIGDSSYDLCLDGDYKWYIRSGDKILLRYNEDTKLWMGVKNGKIIKIQWPTFRDIVNQYLVQ